MTTSSNFLLVAFPSVVNHSSQLVHCKIRST